MSPVIQNTVLFSASYLNLQNRKNSDKKTDISPFHLEYFDTFIKALTSIISQNMK